MDTKRFSLRKSLLSLLVAVLLTFTLIACGDNDADLVEEALDSLAIVFASGDDADNVTRNLNLPTTVGDVTITWSSSNPTVVSNAGVVTRQFTDVTVTLTATAVLNDVTETADFEVKVIRVDVQAALDAIALTGDNISYNATTEKYTVVGNVTLPATSNGVAVAWESTNLAVMSNAGAVTRPAYGENDANILLIATINNVEREFEIVVPAITEKPAALILQEASDQLLLAGTSNGVSQNLTLPTTVGTEGVTVTWSSDTPAVISNTGVVVRTEVNVTVVLTATLHYGTETLEKEFEVVVLAAENFELVADIAEAISISKDGLSYNRTYVKINAVTIMGITNDGVVFADDSGFLFAYMGSRRDDLVVGDVYDVIGLTDRYFGSWQLNNTAVSATPVIWIESDAAVTVVTPVVANSVTDMMANHAIPTTEAPDIDYVYYRLTAKVRVQNPGDNYGTVFVNPDYIGDDIPTAPNSAHATDGVMIYYQSNKAAFDAFDGVTVTFNALFYGYRSDRTVFTILFIETVDDIENTLTDTELVDVAGLSLQNNFMTEYTEATTVSLPSSLLGTSIAWASSHDTLIDPVTGAVTLPAEGQVEVTLTATITLNAVEKEFTYKINVGELELSTIADARLEDNMTKVLIEGVITGFAYNTSFNNATVYIQDATAGVNLYRLSGTGVADLVVGDKISVVGMKNTSNGLVRIQDFEEYELISSGNAFVPVEVVEADEFINFQSQFVYVTGTLKAKPNVSTTGWDDSTVVQVGAKEVKLYIHHPGDMDATERTALVDLLNGLEAGDTISAFGPMGWYNAPQIVVYAPEHIVVGGYVELTDAQKAEQAAGLLTIPTEIEETTTLALPATGAHSSTVTWVSSDNAVINDATGEVVLPATGNVTVTLTATVTVGVEEFVRVETITVGEIIRTVAYARAAAVDTVMTIEATISAVAFDSSDRGVVFVEDANDGIYLYKVPADYKADLVVGNTIKFRGNRAVFGDLAQINNFVSVEVVTTGNTVTPTVVTDPTMLPTYEGQLVSITGYLREEYAGTPSNFYLVTTAGTFTIRLVSGSDQVTAVRDAAQASLVGVAEGTEVTIVAGLGRYFNNFQIMLFNDTQVTLGAVGSDVNLGAVAVAHMDLPAADNEVVADLTLPATGLFGTTYVWTSSNTAVITDAGVVTRPEYPAADAVVTMSYEFKMGETVLASGAVEFTVLATEEVIVDGPVTVVAAYTGDTTTNMTAGNNATLIGLDETIFTVTSTERVNSPLHVGLNSSGQIRLYGSSDTEGNILTIALSEDYIITEVEFAFGTTVGNALIMTGTTEQFNGALTASEVKTYSGLAVNDFSIQNKNASTGQIYILSITITYEVVEAGTLMIYELYGGGGNSGATYSNDYVVLYNGTSAAIDLSAYSLHYASSTGVFNATYNKFDLVGTIEAGGYFLIQLAGGTTVTDKPLPTPDQSSSVINMAGSNGKIALAMGSVADLTLSGSGDPAVVDFVGFGTANDFETAATPALSNTTSAQRTSFVDSNDNSVDFAVVTPDLSYLS
ncbi:MAG: lamin tail domain-containing protein [Tenericutes bacterium]|nr:lamin tail domain-containing protein [Mycoplasmatota bacterium]